MVSMKLVYSWVWSVDDYKIVSMLIVGRGEDWGHS